MSAVTNVVTTIDYTTLAVITGASAFFGAFGKELADFIITGLKNMIKTAKEKNTALKTNSQESKTNDVKTT